MQANHISSTKKTNTARALTRTGLIRINTKSRRYVCRKQMQSQYTHVSRHMCVRNALNSLSIYIQRLCYHYVGHRWQMLRQNSFKPEMSYVGKNTQLVIRTLLHRNYMPNTDMYVSVLICKIIRCRSQSNVFV